MAKSNPDHQDSLTMLQDGVEDSRVPESGQNLL